MTSIHMLTHMTYTCLPAYTCIVSNTHPYPHIYTKKKKSEWERLETCLIWRRKQGTCLFVSGFIEMVWCLAAILPAFTASSQAWSEVASRDQIDESVTGVRFESILCLAAKPFLKLRQYADFPENKTSECQCLCNILKELSCAKNLWILLI